MKSLKEKKADFENDEVLKIKGFLFKIVLIDAFTGKIALKQISEQEAAYLETRSQEERKQES